VMVLSLRTPSEPWSVLRRAEHSQHVCARGRDPPHVWVRAGPCCALPRGTAARADSGRTLGSHGQEIQRAARRAAKLVAGWVVLPLLHCRYHCHRSAVSQPHPHCAESGRRTTKLAAGWAQPLCRRLRESAQAPRVFRSFPVGSGRQGRLPQGCDQLRVRTKPRSVILCKTVQGMPPATIPAWAPRSTLTAPASSGQAPRGQVMSPATLSARARRSTLTAPASSGQAPCTWPQQP